jgi:hypothetical protein
MRQPTANEYASLIEIINENGETIQTLSKMEYVAVFDDYCTDSPGFNGTLFVIVWPASPEAITLIGMDKDKNWHNFKPDLNYS